jgi:hypothetical protein
MGRRPLPFTYARITYTHTDTDTHTHTHTHTHTALTVYERCCTSVGVPRTVYERFCTLVSFAHTVYGPSCTLVSTRIRARTRTRPRTHIHTRSHTGVKLIIITIPDLSKWPTGKKNRMFANKCACCKITACEHKSFRSVSGKMQSEWWYCPHGRLGSELLQLPGFSQHQSCYSYPDPLSPQQQQCCLGIIRLSRRRRAKVTLIMTVPLAVTEFQVQLQVEAQADRDLASESDHWHIR